MKTQHIQEMDTWAPKPEPKWPWPATARLALALALMTWSVVLWLVSWWLS